MIFQHGAHTGRALLNKHFVFFYLCTFRPQLIYLLARRAHIFILINDTLLLLFYFELLSSLRSRKTSTKSETWRRKCMLSYFPRR